MNSGATAERVYEAIRKRIMRRGFRPGDRLDPAALADLVASSVTPVRDALHILAGEGLVITRTGEGFSLPQLDQPTLDDLYAWAGEVLVLAVRGWPSGMSLTARDSERAPLELEPAERTAALFEQVASLSENAEHRSAVASLNARLHAVRMAEPAVLAGIGAELEAIEAALAGRDRLELRRLLATYHRRRRRCCAEIVRALYRS